MDRQRTDLVNLNNRKHIPMTRHLLASTMLASLLATSPALAQSNAMMSTAQLAAKYPHALYPGRIGHHNPRIGKPNLHAPRMRAERGPYVRGAMKSGIVTTAIRAADFLNILGFNMHISQGSANFGDAPLIVAEMQYAGAKHARDNLNPWNGWASTYVGVAQGGIKWTFILGTGGAYTPATLAAFLAPTYATPATTPPSLAGQGDALDYIAQQVPGSIEAAEGFNEINNWPITWNGAANSTATAAAAQAAYYADVHADTNLGGAKVDYFTGYCFDGTPNWSCLPASANINPYTTAGLADYDTQHPYPGTNGYPWGWINLATALPNESAPFGPVVYTETGYRTGTGYSSVAMKTSGSLDIWADAALQGVSIVDFYLLQDEGDGWGYFAPATSAQTAAATTPALNATLAASLATPAAVAMHNLSAILADTGATASTFTPTPTFSVTGTTLPTTANTLRIMSSGGTEFLMLWNESATPATGTVTLSAPVATATTYDPEVGTAAVSSVTNAQVLNVTLGDHPILIALNGTATTVTPPVVTPPVVTPPTFTVSPTGTTITAPGKTITDTNGVQYGLTSAGQISITPLGGTAFVEATSKGVTALYWGGADPVDQLGGGNWWTQPAAGGPGTELTAPPAGYIAPVVTPPAPTAISATPATETVSTVAGTAAKPFSGVVITDANTGTDTATIKTTAGTLSATTFSGTPSVVAADLNALTLTPASGAASTATVTAAITDTAGQSASLTSTVAATYTPPPPVIVPSAAGTVATPTNGVTITDLAGNTWTFVGGVLEENGKAYTSALPGAVVLDWTGATLLEFANVPTVATLP